MSEIVYIKENRVFSFQEANEILPVIYRITEDHSNKVQALIDRLDTNNGRDDDFISAIEEQINAIIRQWQDKIRKLGANAKGLWIADFDSGEGYYCWKYPEKRVQYWHDYRDGFSKRVEITANGEKKPCLPSDNSKRKFFDRLL